MINTQASYAGDRKNIRKTRRIKHDDCKSCIVSLEKLSSFKKFILARMQIIHKCMLCSSGGHIFQAQNPGPPPNSPPPHHKGCSVFVKASLDCQLEKKTLIDLKSEVKCRFKYIVSRKILETH